MNCSEAQERLNALALSTSDKEIEAELMEHVRNCPDCTELLGVQRTLGEDFRRLSSEARVRPMTLQTLKDRVLLREQAPKGRQVKTTLIPRRGERWASPRRLGWSAAVVAAVAIVFTLLPFSFEDELGYQVAVAGVDESLVTSGAISDLFMAVGLTKAAIEVISCTPACSLVVSGLTTTLEAQTAAAAIFAANDIYVASKESFVDQKTGLPITITKTDLRAAIFKGTWTLELDIDSAISRRISVALDSLQDDTTITWTTWLKAGEDTVESTTEGYRVNPDGSYFNTISSSPNSQTGWSEMTWQFDTAGRAVAHTITDTLGIEFDIDFQNWTVMEKQLRRFGIYHMVTYDETGTPYHTALDVDPAAEGLDRPNLAEGMYLNQNRPNPFDTLTSLVFGIPQAAKVRLEIYNQNSELVRTLVDKAMSAGEHEIKWDATDDSGKRVHSRLFMAKLTVGDYYHTIVMSQVW